MLKPLGTHAVTSAAAPAANAGLPYANTAELAALVALEEIGVRRSFERDGEIYAEGDASNCWFRVVSGTVRITKLLADGRRYIVDFCFAGDCFGLDTGAGRFFAAEAIGEVVVMRYPRHSTDQLIENDARVAHRFCDLTLQSLAQAQARMLLLGRMTASERVASFLLEIAERCDTPRAIDIPMSRLDIADYLGLTIETVCRVLSAFKRKGIIGIPGPHRIELRDRDALRALRDA